VAHEPYARPPESPTATILQPKCVRTGGSGWGSLGAGCDSRELPPSCCSPRRAAGAAAERGVINDLKVYPVLDGNTGTNLALTVRAVVEEFQQSTAETIAEVASSAYRAVKEPVEGTMLTVIREMATAAQGMPDTLGLDKLLVAVEEAGRAAVEKTTAQLPALQKAGVVDAGGYGLLVLFRGVAAGIFELMQAGFVLSAAAVALRRGEGVGVPACRRLPRPSSRRIATAPAC
jgi:DAK2 domain